MQTNLVKAFISAASVRMPAEFMCLPRVIDRPMPKKMTPNLARFIRSTMSLMLLEGQADFGDARLVHGLVLDQRPQRRADLEVLARLDLQEDVGRLGAGRFADVDEDHRAALAALGDELALLGERVLAEVPRMAFRRVAAPVDDEVRPVLDFAQRARDLATQLGGYFSGAVSKRGVAVDHASDHFGQGDGAALRLARDVAEPVDQRHVGVVQDVGRDFDGLVPRWRACRRSARRDSGAPPCGI